jgi:hypothetical protein
MKNIKDTLSALELGDNITDDELLALYVEMNNSETSLRKINNPAYKLVVNDISETRMRLEEYGASRGLARKIIDIQMGESK